jgi:alpha-beta hydrolase superfamily lysophospholipase
MLLFNSFSEGVRFYIPNSWMVNRDDLQEFSLFVASQHDPGMPFFLGGDSYGGCLAIHVGRKFQDSPKDAPSGFRGLCLTAPAIVGDLPPVRTYQRTIMNKQVNTNKLIRQGFDLNLVTLNFLLSFLFGFRGKAPVVFFVRRILMPLAPKWTPFFMPNPIGE